MIETNTTQTMVLANWFGTTVTVKSAIPSIENGEYTLEGQDTAGFFLTAKSGLNANKILYATHGQVVLILPALSQARTRVA
jgi:hypothetical protein